MNNMFFGASSFDQDISNWCVENIISEPSNFSLNSLLQENFKPVWGTCPNPNFTLAPNGVTCLCPDAAVGESGPLVIDGVSKTFTKRDRTQLLALIANDVTDPQIALTCTSGITDMSGLFSGTLSDQNTFNQDISSWDVSNVIDMSRMFLFATSFDQPLNDWDVSGETDISRMFNQASAFNQPLNNWDVSQVTNMQGMFSVATAFDQPLDNWDVSGVTDMSFMFNFASAFNQPLNNWDTSSVTDMFGMFQGAEVFNQPLNNWNVSNVTNMRAMFAFADAFNQPINNWDVSQVTNMASMFQYNISFNQPLNDWDVSSVTAMEFMFFNAPSFDQDISNWCVENIISEPSNFSVSSPLQESFKPVWGTCPLIFENIFTSTGVAEGAVAFADVDGDNDQDLFLSGARLNFNGTLNNEVARIYLNDGAGNYTFMNTIGLPIVGRSYSSASFIDLNNDTTPDLVHTGEAFQTGINYGEFFTNDGLGDFSSFTGMPFLNGLEKIDFKFANLDGDTDKDVVIIAQDISGTPTTLTFRNTSPLGFYTNFNPKLNNLPQVLSGSIDLADVDGDGDNDIFISGRLISGSKIAELYLNQGNYQFSLATQFTGVDHGDSRFADLDNDGDQDLLISGKDMNENNILKLYFNDGGAFTEVTNAVSVDENILIQAFDFGDIDGDSDLDLFMTGYSTTGNNQPIAQIWENKLVDLLQKNSGNRSDLFDEISKDEMIANFGYNFRLYPNPTADGKFNIHAPGIEGEVQVKLFSLDGRTLTSESLLVEREDVFVNAGALSTGIYLVKLVQEENVVNLRLIVK
jgi:surface protein